MLVMLRVMSTRIPSSSSELHAASDSYDEPSLGDEKQSASALSTVPSDPASSLSAMWTESLGFYDLILDISCLRKLHQGWRVLSRSESSLAIDSDSARSSTLPPQQIRSSTNVRTFGVFGNQRCGKTWFLQRFLALPNIDVTRVIPTRTC